MLGVARRVDDGLDNMEAQREMSYQDELERIRIEQNKVAISIYNAKCDEDRKNTRAQHPQHGDILVNDNADTVAWYNDPGNDVFGYWKFITPNGYAETRGGMDIEQQYYDRETGIAEWVTESTFDDEWENDDNW